MPVISRFSGLTIKMFFRQKEHNPSHVHVTYAGYIGIFAIADGEMFEGDLPIKEQQKVRRFISFYREKLLNMWETQQFALLPSIDGRGEED